MYPDLGIFPDHHVESHRAGNSTRRRTELDQYLLDELLPDKPLMTPTAPLARYVIKLARLVGYLARVHDPPLGNTLIWSVSRD